METAAEGDDTEQENEGLSGCEDNESEDDESGDDEAGPASRLCGQIAWNIVLLQLKVTNASM